jgi:hypothetical protein
MRIRMLSLLLGIGVLGLLLTASAATQSRTKTRVVDGPVGALAMDGARVAYDVTARNAVPARCNRVRTWNVATGSNTVVSGRRTCGADSTSTGAGVRELVVAGTRVAWIVNLGGNTESNDYLYTSSIPSPSERLRLWAQRVGNVDGVLAGEWLGGLVGSDSVLALNRWTTDRDGAVTASALDAVGPSSFRRIVSGPGSMTAKVADSGRIAVHRPDGTVAIHATNGRVLSTAATESVRELSLQGLTLVVLRRDRALEVYDARSGARLRRWRVAPGAASLDVQSGLAVYSVGRQVRVLRLLTGKDKVLVTARNVVKGVEIEAPGLVYATNVRNGGRVTGRLVFVPFAAVRAAVP